MFNMYIVIKIHRTGKYLSIVLFNTALHIVQTLQLYYFEKDKLKGRVEHNNICNPVVFFY